MCMCVCKWEHHTSRGMPAPPLTTHKCNLLPPWRTPPVSACRLHVQSQTVNRTGAGRGGRSWGVAPNQQTEWLREMMRLIAPFSSCATSDYRTWHVSFWPTDMYLYRRRAPALHKRADTPLREFVHVITPDVVQEGSALGIVRKAQNAVRVPGEGGAEQPLHVTPAHRRVQLHAVRGGSAGAHRKQVRHVPQRQRETAQILDQSVDCQGALHALRAPWERAWNTEACAHAHWGVGIGAWPQGALVVNLHTLLKGLPTKLPPQKIRTTP